MSQTAYQATLNFLFSQLPMFQRVGVAAYKKDLSNTKALCKFLGHPEKGLKCIHIAGTNGKGSTAHMLAAVLQAAGFKTGLYTSPHLRDFRERIRINGEMISEQEVVSFTDQVKPLIESIQPSFFELTVGMAFDHFMRHEVAIAVIETGLGGRLDSTNVITPLLSVITNIGFDHMDLLGNTLPLIAVEKAGIIKSDVPIIVGEKQEEVYAVFEKTANEKRALLKYADQIFEARLEQASHSSQTFSVWKNNRCVHEALQLDLAGHYQQKNLQTVLASIDQLINMGWAIETKAIQAGLANCCLLTGFAGRWTVLQEKPLTIADTAHNLPGIELLLKQLNQLKYEQMHFVISMVKDKDIDKILSILPKNAIYYFSKAGIPRGLDAAILAQQAAPYQLKGAVYNSVALAFEAAKTAAEENDLIFISGSTFTVAEII